MASKRSGAPLTAAFVRSVSKPGRYGDGRGGFGLSLLVTRRANGRTNKRWQQAYIDPRTGRPTSMALGRYPVVTLAEARRLALDHQRLIAAGHHPRHGGPPTLAKATERVIDLHRAGWKAGSKTERQWRNSFEAHVFPSLGRKRIDQITTADVLAVLEPLWHTKPSIAEVLKLRISQTMRWAIAQGYRADNPAGEALTAALPKTNGGVKHHRALPHADVAEALGKIEVSKAAPAVKLAIRFLALTAVRTNEVRGARWSEIDTETATWTIPGERMKSGKAHRVPLSEAALHVLAQARERWGSEGLVFPGRGGNPLGHASVGTLFRRLELKGTPHGLRSSFRDWCGETEVPRELAEQALAHVVGGVEGAYARSDLLDRRRVLMQSWGEYLEG